MKDFFLFFFFLIIPLVLLCLPALSLFLLLKTRVNSNYRPSIVFSSLLSISFPFPLFFFFSFLELEGVLVVKRVLLVLRKIQCVCYFKQPWRFFDRGFFFLC